VTQTDDEEVKSVVSEIVAQVTVELEAEGVPASEQEHRVEIDLRYSGQAFEVPLSAPVNSTIAELVQRFDAEHLRLFTFNLPVPQEIVNIRVVALGKAANVSAERIEKGSGDPTSAKLYDHKLWMDGREQDAVIYDRARLRSGDRVPGPAIITEMDSTTLVHTGHVASVDDFGNLLINPEGR
jgi:N-methylhydantoinase A